MIGGWLRPAVDPWAGHPLVLDPWQVAPAILPPFRWFG